MQAVHPEYGGEKLPQCAQQLALQLYSRILVRADTGYMTLSMATHSAKGSSRVVLLIPPKAHE